MLRIAILLALVILPPAFSQTSADRLDECYPITARDLRRANAPTFEQFPAEDLLTRWAPADIDSSPQARAHKTVLERGTVKGPNFAGRYSIVGWGCGSSCVTFAIVNRKTGKVIFPENVGSISGTHLYADDFQADAGTGYWGLRFRRDSRLLILLGAIDEDEAHEGAFYYVIENDLLKPVFSVRVKKHWCGQ